MPHVMVAASGPDQPGIVAEITRVLAERECNLEDTSMTVLRGHFAMMLVVEVPDGVAPEDLETDLAFATTALGLIVNVWETSPLVGATPSGQHWTLSIRGADRKGIVHAFAALLAKNDVSIDDVSTRLTDDGEYSMELVVIVPAGRDAKELGIELAAMSRDLDVDCTFEHDLD